ncbi:MAG: hypothetical protein WAZ12_04550, partial [Candidatus Absconditicoccaceae bacterium]
GEVITGDTNTGEVITGDTNTGEVITGDTNTGEVITGDTNTGEVITGDTNTGEVITGDTNTGEVISGGFNQEPVNQLSICNNSDFNFINPLSGSKLKGMINFSRTYPGTDCSGKNFDIYLYDHNSQWIKIGTSSYLNTRFQFNSSQLYSGFYNILSGNGDIIYTGQYSGLNSKFYTGYQIKLIDQNQDIIYTGDIFTIDNQLPEITGIIIEFTGNYNLGYIGLSGIVNLNFTSTEDITGIIVNILGLNANFISKSGFTYKYSLTLSSQNTGSTVYSNISFSDLALNTGSKYLTSQVFFDKTIPVLNYILFTGTYTGVDILRSGNELTKYTFTYTLSGSQTGITLTGLNYLYTGLLNITGLVQNKVYHFVLKLTDPVNNILAIGGDIYFITGGKVGFTHQTITLTSNIVVNVATGSTIATVIKQEINKFNNCKSDIKITNINIKVNNQDIKLNMPNFDKSDIRKIVNSFTIVIMDKLQKSTLTKSDLDDIVNRFDDFLIILKLVRDDDNQCKQNLSNYHIRLFQKTLEEYKISIE